MKSKTAIRVMFILLFLVNSTRAQHAVMESEPNDTPVDALAIAGEVTLIGSMAGNDQDAYMWTVSDVDAQKRWTFELRGIPGRLTIVEIVRVKYADNGIDIVATDRLMKLGTRDGLKPSIQEDLIFEPGEYVLGVAAAGGEGTAFRPPTTSLSFGPEDDAALAKMSEAGSYRLIISEGSRLPLVGSPKSRETRESSYAARLDREFAALTFEQSSWYRFDFDEKQSSRRWDISAQVPVGRKMKARLYAEDGETLASTSADDRGKLGFKDLAPPVGSWWVELQMEEEGGFIQAVGAEAVGMRIAGAEAEPNGKWNLANRVDLTRPLTGRTSEDSDGDYFWFSVDESLSDQALSLELENLSGKRVELCLYDSRQTRLQCRSGTGSLVLPGLVLMPGDWGLSVSRGRAGTEYSISLSSQGGISPGMEAEPNDALALASSVPAKNRIKGSFSGDESDFFRFVVADKPQLWRFQVIGDGITEVGYHDAAGHQSQRVRPAHGQRRVRLDNVYLLPGVHHLQVKGKDGGSYTVLARPVGRADPNGEREPNNDTRHTQNIAIGQTRTGLLEDKDDRDFYRFFLANNDRIRLTIQAPSDGSVLPALYWYSEPMKEIRTSIVGEPIVLEGLFPPGDYHFSLSPGETSEAEYTISLERLDRFDCSVDCEPNDNSAFANPVPENLVVEGIVGDWRDHDVYALPVRSEPTKWTFKPSPYRTLKVATGWKEKSIVEYDKDAELFRGVVPAGQSYYLFITGNRSEPYRIQLDYPGRLDDERSTTAPAVALSLNLESTEIAAYRRNGQRVQGLLAIRNESPEILSLKLEAVTSDYRWLVRLDKTDVQVAPWAQTSIPVIVTVPQDAWADRPVRVSVNAENNGGQHVETFQEIGAGRETAPVNPQWGWTIPETLMGGFDVALTSLGSRLIGAYDTSIGAGFEKLFNGVDVRGQGLTLRGGWKGEDGRDVVIELAGGQSIEIVGTAVRLFNKQSAWHDLSVLELALSGDGITFTTVLDQNLQPIKTDQYFVLDEPVLARYARLRLKHTFSGTSGDPISLSEWKLFARPGIDLSKGQGFNLADHSLGGHIVYSRPLVSVDWDQALLEYEKENIRIRPDPGEEFEFVVGFHHNRAAQITRLDWLTSSDTDSALPFSEVRVAVSLESPFGPWRSLGTWKLASDGSNTEITLEQPEWARFVRFTSPGTDSRDVRATPEQIRIWERPTGEGYRSIISEWGYASKEAFYEWQQDLVVDQPVKLAGHDSRQRAAPLDFGQAAGGAVSLGKHEHWYQLTVPVGQNTLLIRMDGNPTVRTSLHLEDESGGEVRLMGSPNLDTPRTHWHEATVEPGQVYYLRIEEPPRNVIFAWDTSPSVLPYIPTIYNSLVAFTDDVVPGRDAVNLLPFGSSPLLRDWYGEPYILQTVLNDYLQKESSSAAERSLRRASRALSPLPGTKAIVVITDATMTREARMWDEFEEVRPRVFGIGVGGGPGADNEQDFFQNWSDVNDGHYQHMVYDGEMEIAFDRAATMLRRPAEYKLLVDTEFREDPGPGLLTVASGGGGTDYAGAIEMILDASGSMWQRLDGKFRINIAKEVLTETIEKRIPAGTPTVLRVFGHREPNACRTDLEIPLQPLDPASAVTAIRSIDPKSLARTPIADSIAKIESDLRNSEGRKTVVLVTDGKETCGGHPEDVIRKLRDKGFDISLNIVGFAIDDAELEDTFAEWAKLGNGRYFSANDQEGLGDAIAAALRIPYSVYDASGSMVATGMVGGDTLELLAGQYRVVVSSSPQQTFEKVQITGGRPTTLELE